MSDIVHLSYSRVRPTYTNPERWLSGVAFVSGVVEKLVSIGKQTVIYHIDYKGELERRGVRYIFTGFRSRQLILPFAFNRLIRSLKPDVVLVHGLIFPWQIIMLRKVIGPNVKIICQHHADRPFRDFRKYFFRWADKYVAGYLFAAKEHAGEWLKAGQISSMEKVHEIMAMSSIFRPWDQQKEEGGKKEKNYLWIGDLDNNKDPLLAARAFARFSESHPDVELHMIYQQTHLEGELKKIATPNIHLVGKVEHTKMQDYFNNASFIISTSHYESAGIAVCEAMSCGCFPILTNIPSFRMMTGNGKLGRLFEAGDEDGLLNVLEETFGATQSQKVIEYFTAELSFEANARKIINVIKEL